MSSKTKTIDLWKKYNRLCKDDAALSAKINADPFVIGILTTMSAMLHAIPNTPRELLTTLTTVAPIPHALYFGEPCPFREQRSRAQEEAQQLYTTLADSLGELRQIAFAWAGIPGYLRGFVAWLEDTDARITIDALFGETSNPVLCLTWLGLCGQLRERVWTLARLHKAILSIEHFRE